MFETKIQSILQKGEGTKVALFDEHTKRIMSSLITQTQFLESNFFLFHMLSDQRARMMSLTAVVFLRPESIYDILKELKNPLYGRYIVFFTTKIDEDILEILAKADKYSMIHEVYEMNLDIIKIDHGFYQISNHLNDGYLSDSSIKSLCSVFSTLGISPKMILHESAQEHIRKLIQNREKNKSLESAVDIECLNKAVSTNLSLYKVQNKDESTTPVSKQMNSSERKPFINFFETVKNHTISYLKSGTLIFLNRRFDMITPLLYEWRYQSMIKEYFNEHQIGILKLDKFYCYNTDRFFQNNKFLDINKVSGNLKRFVNDQNGELNLDNFRNKESAEMHLKIHNHIVKYCLENKEISEIEMKILKENNMNTKSLISLIDQIKTKLSHDTDLDMKIQKLILIFLMKNPEKTDREFFQKYPQILRFVQKYKNTTHIRFKDHIDIKLAYEPPIKKLLSKVVKNKPERHFKVLSNTQNNPQTKNEAPYLIYIDQLTMNEYRAIDAFFAEHKIDNYIIICEKIICWRDVIDEINK